MAGMAPTATEEAFLAGHRLGRLAIGPGGGPQVKPVGIAYTHELRHHRHGGPINGIDPISGMEERRAVADADGDRPLLGAGGLAADGAAEAVQGLVAELQAGLDSSDADVYNRHFAADVIWGSPFGATVHGYDRLHAIHVQLKRERRGGPSSRYEIVAVLSPAPGWRWPRSGGSPSIRTASR